MALRATLVPWRGSRGAREMFWAFFRHKRLNREVNFAWTKLSSWRVFLKQINLFEKILLENTLQEDSLVHANLTSLLRR